MIFKVVFEDGNRTLLGLEHSADRPWLSKPVAALPRWTVYALNRGLAQYPVGVIDRKSAYA